MFPNFHVLVLDRFYQTLNLSLRMPIYHYFDTFTSAAEQIYQKPYFWPLLYG